MESLNLCLTSNAGHSMAFQIFQPQPCGVVRRNTVCFTTLFVALNEITYYSVGTSLYSTSYVKMVRQEEMWVKAPILSLPYQGHLVHLCLTHHLVTQRRGEWDLAVLPTLQSLAHDLPKFITTLLFILLKRIQGIWKFSTRIHPNHLSIHLLTSGPGYMITGLTHKNKSPRINIKMLVLIITLQNTQM